MYSSFAHWAHVGNILRKCVRYISTVTGNHISGTYCDYIPDVTQMFPAVPSQVHVVVTFQM